MVGWVFCFRSKSLQFLAVKNEYINKWGLNAFINSFIETEGRVFLKKDTVQKSYYYSNVSAACNLGVSLICKNSDIQKLDSN